MYERVLAMLPVAWSEKSGFSSRAILVPYPRLGDDNGVGVIYLSFSSAAIGLREVASWVCLDNVPGVRAEAVALSVIPEPLLRKFEVRVGVSGDMEEGSGAIYVVSDAVTFGKRSIFFVSSGRVPYGKIDTFSPVSWGKGIGGSCYSDADF